MRRTGFIILHYKTDVETPPSFMGEALVCSPKGGNVSINLCREAKEKKDILICFLPIEDTSKFESWGNFLNQINIVDDIEITVFSHDIRRNNQDFAEEISTDARVKMNIDYSSGDVSSYKAVWNQLSKSEDCEQLEKILNDLVKSYVVDPLRRVKHRAMNLFGPISVDIQLLLEMWEKKDYSEAKKHVADLGREWQGSATGSKSLLSQLARLWYMLVGDKLNWGEFGVPQSPHDVSLPKDEESKGLSFYEWLVKYLGLENVEQFPEWRCLIKEVQLCPYRGKFRLILDHGIYSFSKMLGEKIVGIVDVDPEQVAEGFEGDMSFQKQLQGFLGWLQELNDSFENVIKSWGKKPSSSLSQNTGTN